MFYEETVINGVVHCRTTPNGEWRVANSKPALARTALLALTDQERLEVFARFCVHCGTDKLPCVCMRDE